MILSSTKNCDIIVLTYFDEKRTYDMIHVPRVCAFHDMAGYGKCALTVVIPVMSACGVEVCPVPTANLSTNTSIKGFQMTDFTENIPQYLRHWADIGVKLDGIYSGFLGSAEQIDMVAEMKKTFNPPLFVIDPVMGDNGKRYKTFDDFMCGKMKEIAKSADVITPNLTEAMILTDGDYGSFAVTEENLKDVCLKIQELGAKDVVLTGAPYGDELWTAVLDKNGLFDIVRQKKLPINMHGTGDTFTSVLCGKMLTGKSLLESAQIAADFVSYAMEYSYGVEDYIVRGVVFEPLLHKLR